MNFRVNINICRVCMKPEQGASLLEDPELQAKFVFTTRLEFSENDDMPAIICWKCVTRLKVAHEFVQLAKASDKNLKEFLAKISKDFQQVTKSSPEKPKEDAVEEEDEELILLGLENDEQEATQEQPIHNETKPEKLEGPKQQPAAASKRKIGTVHPPTPRKMPNSKCLRLAVGNEIVKPEVREEENENDEEFEQKTEMDTEFSLEMESSGEDGCIQYTLKCPDIPKLNDSLETNNEGTDEESPTELVEMLDENLPQSEHIKIENEQTEQPRAQREENGFLKQYEAMLEESGEFLDEEVDNENAMDEHLNLYENSESVPDQDDCTITEVLDQVDTFDAEEQLKSGYAAISSPGAMPHVVKTRTRKTPAGRGGSGTSPGGSKSSKKNPTAPVNTRYFCFECNRDFSTKTNLTRHMATHGGNRPFQCNVCGKGFTQNASLKQHMYTHTGEKPYVCEICNRGFTQCKSLVFHMRRHTGEKPFPCTKCGINFRQKDGLKIHILRHHTISKSEGNSEIHTCVICKEVMEDKYSLQVHMKKHVNNHDIADEVAGGNTSQNSEDILMEIIDEEELLNEKQNLISEILPLNVEDISSSTHVVDVTATSASEPARAKKYQCRKCFKCFAIKKSLIRHLWIHDVPATEQFLCKSCNITFDTHKALKAHEQNEHKSRGAGSKRYECNMCQMSYESANMLNVHINMEHELICPECPNIQFASQKELIEHTVSEHDLNDED